MKRPAFSRSGFAGKSLTGLLLTVFVGVLALCLLLGAAPVGEGVRRGLTICTTVVIPSLFPFLVLAGFISLSPVCELLARPLGPITTGLLGLPKELGTVVLMSFLGGYPVGARLLSSLQEQGRVDGGTVSRMLCFCVNAGPSFLISAVGVALYTSPRIGVCLLGAQVLSALLMGMGIGWLGRGRGHRAMPLGERPRMPVTAALVQAVTGGAMGMFSICAFVVIFSGLITFLNASGALPALAAFLARTLPFGVGSDFYAALFTGLLEVTGGCVAAAALPGRTAFLLTAFLISFGGLSILCQVVACFPGGKVDFRPLLLSRLAGGILTTAIAAPLYDRFCAGYPVYSSLYPPILVVSPKSALIAICLIGMCSIVLLGVSLRVLEKPETR